MYRISDRPAAIESIQRYLRVAGNPDIFVAPTGVFDENTRLSVIDFQQREGLNPDGVVDKITFDMLFAAYTLLSEKDRINKNLDSFITFPLIPGQYAESMIHINRTLMRLLEHYGHHHNLRDSNLYSKNTSDAVKTIRKIYLLRDEDLIDEELYGRMITDHNSIGDSDYILNV